MIECVRFFADVFKDLAPLIISGIAIWLTNRYQRHTKKLANDKMMKELFTEFNQRYDKINNSLAIIAKLSVEEWEELDKKQQTQNEGVIVDFFNICAEEYYWHSQGRINGNIWSSWHKGMNDIYNQSQVIQNIWEVECKNDGYKSYYISKKDDIFKIKK
jgi:hypothetical protein